MPDSRSVTKDVRLAPVTGRNWQAVAGLKLAPDQEDLVASNLWSIAEAQFDRGANPRAIYAGKRLVGFLMYDPGGRTGEALIYRFMVDRAHQGAGYGRAALLLCVEEMRAREGILRVAISYMPENVVAAGFYASLGFVESGRDEDGEMKAVLTL